MPSTFRIPATEVPGLYGRFLRWYTRRTFGQVPDNALVLAHQPKALKAWLGFEGKVSKLDKLAPDLQSYAQMASASAIGCSWCTDFGYFMAHNSGLELSKLREVPRWRSSDVFTPLEREVLAYAEDMSALPPTVTDEQVAALVRQLGAPAVAELTFLVALENMRSRFNGAAGLQSQGFSDVCELPLSSAS